MGGQSDDFLFLKVIAPCIKGTLEQGRANKLKVTCIGLPDIGFFFSFLN